MPYKSKQNATNKKEKNIKGQRVHSLTKMTWDGIMTVIALVNLVLIVFDLTYMQFRALYISYAPNIVKIYDPVKGIESEPRTIRAMQCSSEFIKYKNSFHARRQKAGKCKKLYTDLYDQGSFVASGREDVFAKILGILNHESGLQTQSQDANAAHTIIQMYWDYATRNPENHSHIYENEIKPLMEVNFRRKVNFSGQYIDDFYKIDTPFLVFFLIEFIFRWGISIRRKEYIAWFLFPLYNWYDVLGLLPVTHLRVFRLVRLYRIYREFRENSLGIQGDDFIASVIKKYSGIIAEEISDMVAVRILSEAQDEVKRGATKKVLVDSFLPIKDEIKTVVKKAVLQPLELPETKTQIRELLEKGLENSARKVPSLQLVPDMIKVRLTREIGLSIYDSLYDAINAHLSSSQNIIDTMVDMVLEDMIASETPTAASGLGDKITLEVLENIKNIVSQKKWATPDMQHFPISFSEKKSDTSSD